MGRRSWSFAAPGVVAVAAVWTSIAFAQQPPDRLTALHREAEALARQERTLLGELRQLEIERDLKTEEVRQAERDLAEVSRQQAEAADRRSALEKQVIAQTPGLSARIVELYKLGRPGYVRLLFDADNVRSAARAYRTVGALVEADSQRAARFRRAVSELRATERALAERGAHIQALEAQKEEARQAAVRAVARHAALIARIDARRDLNAQMIGELQAAQQKLAALSPNAPKPPVESAASVSPLAALRGSLEWPATGNLASRFGSRRDPRFGTTTVRAGIEISATAGTPAAAIEDGVVAFAEPFTGFGNLVIIDHGQQAYSLYGYLDSLAVARGARVARGQALGAIGHSPAGNPALYFELRIDGKAVDPVQWLKRR